MRRLCSSLLLAFSPVAAWSAIEGAVSTAAGTAIEHVQIEVEGDGKAVFTGRTGEFRVKDIEPPATLFFSHPRFETLVLEVDPAAVQPLAVTMVAKQEVYEEIAVTAAPGEDNFSPVSVATSIIDPEELPAPPSTLTDMVVEVPAVSQNGQGGIFQTYSIRGVSRQRVMTLVSGMRIVGDRRAGVSASFLDPRLMRSVDVLRGPSSTFYGSGALGGVIQVFPRRFEGWAGEGGYKSQGDENYLLGGWGDGKWSLGVARRDAGQSKAPSGEILNTGFTQTSGTLERRWTAGKLQYEVLGVASRGLDIGKSNTDYPERLTLYPQEEHYLARFAVRHDSGWKLEAWTHPNSLETHVSEEDELSRVDNEALDFGFNWQQQVKVAGAVATRLGVDFFGRKTFVKYDNVVDGTVQKCGFIGKTGVVSQWTVSVAERCCTSVRSEAMKWSRSDLFSVDKRGQGLVVIIDGGYDNEVFSRLFVLGIGLQRDRATHDAAFDFAIDGVPVGNMDLAGRHVDRESAGGSPFFVDDLTALRVIYSETGHDGA